MGNAYEVAELDQDVVEAVSMFFSRAESFNYKERVQAYNKELFASNDSP